MQVTLSSNSQYFGGHMLAAMDQLGSVGTYYPWGENKGGTNPQDNFSFATYWRDSATSLDYANNRYYSNAYGRFMTPDPYTNSGRLNDPQSWNRYAYTRGDPVNRYDPEGSDDCPAGVACFSVTGTGYGDGGDGGFGGGSSLFGGDPVFNKPFMTRTPVEISGGGEYLQVGAAAGPLTYSNVGKDQAKMNVINTDMSTLESRLGSDPNCLNWLSTGGNYQGLGLLNGLLPTLTVSEGQTSNPDGSANGIWAQANPYPSLNIIVNSGGGFFYGGAVPSANGTIAAIQGNTLSGQLLILIHELAHVNGTAGFAHNDAAANVNGGNNDQVWQHCQKTITGK
jgi:RHS repeat-associated protein